jgi:hypothetical protein
MRGLDGPGDFSGSSGCAIDEKMVEKGHPEWSGPLTILSVFYRYPASDAIRHAMKGRFFLVFPNCGANNDIILEMR